MPTLLITEALRLVNNILEGIPIDQRKAASIQWFWAWWEPIVKPIMKSQHVPDSVIQHIEDMMKSAQ